MKENVAHCLPPSVLRLTADEKRSESDTSLQRQADYAIYVARGNMATVSLTYKKTSSHELRRVYDGLSEGDYVSDKLGDDDRDRLFMDDEVRGVEADLVSRGFGVSYRMYAVCHVGIIGCDMEITW